jgi:DNA-binding transcriptional regulator YdaS (Cro superfamily)
MIAITARERAAVAQAVGLHEQYLYQCFTRRKPLPVRHAPAIERATEGMVTVEQMRPDVRWHRVPDPAWPHPQGRPCIDVAAPADVRDAS